MQGAKAEMMTSDIVQTVKSWQVETLPWSWIVRFKRVRELWPKVDRVFAQAKYRVTDETGDEMPPERSAKFSFEQIQTIVRNLDHTQIWNELDGMRFMLRCNLTCWVNSHPDCLKMYKWMERRAKWSKMDFNSWYLVTKDIAAMVKKWPVLFQQVVGFKRWQRVTEMKNLIGMVYTPSAVLDKRGNRYNVLSEVLRMQLAEPCLFDGDQMADVLQPMFATMKWQGRPQTLPDWMSVPDNFAKGGADPAHKLRGANGELYRITKRATQLATTRDKLMAWVMDREVPEYKALFKIDVGAGRVIYTGDLAVFLLFAYIDACFGSPIKSAAWSSIGKTGSEFIDFFDKLIQMAVSQKWYLIPKDIDNFDFKPSVEAQVRWWNEYYAYGRARIVASQDVLTWMDACAKKIPELIRRGVIIIPMLTLDERKRAIEQNEGGEGKMLNDNLVRAKVAHTNGLLSGEPFTATFGSQYNGAASTFCAGQANTYCGAVSYVNDVDAGDDSQDRSGSVSAIIAAQSAFDAIKLDANPAKGFVARGESEFLRNAINPRGMCQYLARAIPKLWQTDDPPPVSTPEIEVSSWLGQCTAIRHRGGEHGWVEALYAEGLRAIASKWNVPIGWLTAPAWAGGASGITEDRNQWAGTKVRVPDPNLMRYIIDRSWSELSVDTVAAKWNIALTPEWREQAVSDEIAKAAAGIVDQEEDARRGREFRYQMRGQVYTPVSVFQHFKGSMRPPSSRTLTDLSSEVGSTLADASILWGRAPRDQRWSLLESNWRVREPVKVAEKLTEVGLMYGISSLINRYRSKMRGSILLDVLNNSFSAGNALTDPPSPLMSLGTAWAKGQMFYHMERWNVKSMSFAAFSWALADLARNTATTLWASHPGNQLAEIALVS